MKIFILIILNINIFINYTGTPQSVKQVIIFRNENECVQVLENKVLRTQNILGYCQDAILPKNILEKYEFYYDKKIKGTILRLQNKSK